MQQTVFYGVISNIIGSAGNSLGLILQKKASQLQQEKIAKNEIPWKEFNGIVLSPMWLFAFVIMIIIPFPADYIAYMFAPQSLVAPLGAISIVFTILFSPFITGDTITWYNILGIVFIIAGCVLTSIFGSDKNETLKLDEIENLFINPVFLILELCILILGEIAFINLRKNIKIEPILYGYLSSMFGSIQNVLFKLLTSISMLDNTFANWEFYITILGMAFLAFMQLSWLNKGLAKYDSVIMLPIYNTILIILSTINGSIFFKEYTVQTPFQLSMFCVGICLACFGVCIVSSISKKEIIIAENKFSEMKNLTTNTFVRI